MFSRRALTPDVAITPTINANNRGREGETFRLLIL